MKKYLIVIIISLLFPSILFATDIRGRVDVTHQYSYAPFPANGVTVQLFTQSNAGSQLLYTYVTGQDGMYYIPNIHPGNYTLIINYNLKFSVQVLNMGLQDFQPILLP